MYKEIMPASIKFKKHAKDMRKKQFIEEMIAVTIVVTVFLFNLPA